LDVFQSIQRKNIPFMLALTGLPTLFPKLVDEDPLAEAEKAAKIVARDGYVLLWAETVRDFIAFVQDEGMAVRVPPGFVIYTDAELNELFGKGKVYSPATLRLIHEVKKEGGKITGGG
jgi:hypothetical protein